MFRLENITKALFIFSEIEEKASFSSAISFATIGGQRV